MFFPVKIALEKVLLGEKWGFNKKYTPLEQGHSSGIYTFKNGV